MPPVRFEVNGAIVTVTLDRPAARNALTPEMLCRLADAFAAYARDDALRALIVTGAGDQAFCAGGDLGSTIPLLTGARAPADEWDRRLLEDARVLATSGLRERPGDKPIIAAVNGACLAAGCELLLGTDVRIAAERIAVNAPIAVRQIKQVALAASGQPLAQAYALEDAARKQVLATDDAKEGPRAFIEKRAPRYQGR